MVMNLGQAGQLAGEQDRPSCHEPAVRVVDGELGGRPERVLVKDEAVDLERVVDADDLARDLLTVLVHGEVRPEVGEVAGGVPGRLEVDVPDEQVVGVPTAWTGALSPSPKKTTVSA